MAAKVIIIKDSALSPRVKKMSLSAGYTSTAAGMVEEAVAEVHVDWLRWKIDVLDWDVENIREHTWQRRTATSGSTMEISTMEIGLHIGIGYAKE